ncbi:MAG: gliding motility-associated C-terminal domain-containing protein [Saprospiraceae bacterium]
MSDACDLNVSINSSDVLSLDACGLGTVTRTWTAVDCAGNAAVAVTQIIIIVDTTPPVLSGQGADATFECPNSPIFTAPFISDACDPGAVISFSDATNLNLCGEGTITRTWAAMDCAGNSALQVTQTVIIEFEPFDTIPSTSSETDCYFNIVLPVPPSVTDNCGILINPTGPIESEMPSCEGNITYIWTYTDCEGNSQEYVHTVTIEFQPFPAFIQTSETVNCVNEIVVPSPPSMNDNCGNSIIPIGPIVSSPPLCEGNISYSWTYTDCEGNSQDYVHTVTIEYDSFPSISSTSETVACVNAIVVPTPPSVNDNCGNPITPSGPIISGSPTCEGTITYIWTYTDCEGNIQNYIHTVIIEVEPFDPISATFDTIDCYANLILPSPPVVFDNCGEILTPTGPVESGIVSCASDLIFTWTYLDCKGNSQDYIHTVTINDTIPPTASNPASVIVQCIEDVAIPDISVIIDEEDNCTGSIIVAFVGDIVTGNCPKNIIRTYSISDACGNQILVTQSIAINDDISPVASIPPAINVECISDVPAPDITIVTDVTDNCTGPITVVFQNDVSNGAKCPEIISRTYTMTDVCGNTNSVIQMITILDDILPTASNPAPINLLGCNATVPAPDVNVVTDELDNCGILSVSFINDSSSLAGCNETIVRTYRITDSCLNAINVIQIISRTFDTILPVFDFIPADLVVECVAVVPPMIPLAYTDNCSQGGIVPGIESGPSGNPPTIVRTWTVTDDCGNATIATQLIFIDLTLIPNEIYVDFCYGDSVTVYGVVYNTPGTYQDTVASITGGCDTAVVIIVNELPLMDKIVSAEFCFGRSVTVYGEVYSSTGTYFNTIQNITGGCDTALTIIITELPVIVHSMDAQFCYGQSVTIYNVVYSTAGTYLDTIPSLSGGCDTALTITITELPLIQHSVTAQFCFGTSVTVYGIIHNTPGTFFDTIPSLSGGCDTAMIIIISETPLISNSIDVEFCFGESFIVYGIVYNTGGIYHDTIPGTTGGCDTAVIINIIELPLNDLTISENLCPGESVYIYGIVYNAAGSYLDTISSNTGGCDTAVVINIISLPYIELTIAEVLCPGQSVTFYGIIYSAAGTFQINVPSTTGGCDTTVIINISLLPLINLPVSAEICPGDFISIYGVVYNSAGMYSDTIPGNSGGCDTAVTITITQLPLHQLTLVQDLCPGQSVIIYGKIYGSAGIYTDTIPNLTNGCDTAVQIIIMESLLNNLSLSGLLCPNQSITIYGVVYSSAGIYHDTIPGTTGFCDTAVVISISQLPLNLNTITESICPDRSVTIYGVIYSMAGIYHDTVPDIMGGCDTDVTIIIAINPYILNTISASYCEGESVDVNGMIFNSPGIFQDTIGSVTGGCDTAVTITIYEISFVPAQIEPVGPICTSSGQFTLHALPPGGQWSGSVNSDQFDPSILGSGTHNVIYSINSGSCQTTDTIQILVYEITIACQTIQNESAIGANDGEGQVNVLGGMSPYNIVWTGPISGSGTLNADGNFVISNLHAGVYTVQVADATGCVSQCQFVITVPCNLAIVDMNIVDATCAGINNGSVTITASGGLIPYQYSLNGLNYQFSNVFLDLSPGNYSIFVIDDSGCIEQQDAQIGVGAGPQLSIFEIINASCGINNASVQVQATGGSIPYTYSIDAITYVMSPLFQGLGAGHYFIYTIDDIGCTDIISADIIAANAPVILFTDITNASCSQPDGSITIEAAGGHGILSFSIDGGASFQSSPVFSNILSGSYDIVVKDETDCSVYDIVNVLENGAPTIANIIATDASCGMNDASITISANGTPVLMYSLDGINYFTSNVFNNKGPGNYTLYVKDGNGCVVTDQVIVNTVNGPLITNIDVVHTSCGLENGSVLITASGGNLEYIINGISYGGQNFIPNLPDGIYVIEVDDENGCSALDQFTINPSEGPGFDVYITKAHCGQADGSIDLDGFDGRPPYTYSINGSAGPFVVYSIFVNKKKGFYTMAIKDALGCIYEEDVYLTEEAGPQINAVNVIPPGCSLANGIIEVIATGNSNLLYSIQLPNFVTGNIFNPVAPGNYTITVKDQAGCTASTTIVVPSTPSPVITNVNVVNSQCGQSTGSITIIATGGIAPRMYSIGGPFQTSNTFLNLPSGNYTVTVKGANNCEDEQDVVINSSGSEDGSLASSICFGKEFIIQNDTFSAPGNFNILIPGGASNGCDSIIHLTLSLMPLEQQVQHVSICAGDVFTMNGINYSIAGQYVIDTISAIVGCDTILTLDLIINPLETTFLDVSICEGDVFTLGGIDYAQAGEYLIDTVMAEIGCDSIRILRLQVLGLNTLMINASICEGDVYTFNGIDYATTGVFLLDTIPGLGSCDTIRSLNLILEALPVVAAGPDQLLACSSPVVVLQGSAIGGSIIWSGPDINAGNQSDLNPSVSLPGMYILTIISSGGCENMDTVFVIADPEIVISNAGADAFFSCDIDTIILQGGPIGTNLIYQWTGPGINGSNEYLINPIITVPGAYSLIVTDTITDCISQPNTVIITDITANIIAIIQDPLSLTCFSNFVDLNSTGSSNGPNIGYIWFDKLGNIVSTSPFLQVTSGGMFTFVVTDTISGCFDNDSVYVNDLIAYPPVNAGNPQFLDCDHHTARLNEGAINNLKDIIFNWTGPGVLPPVDLMSVLVDKAGQYFITATDTITGCSNADSVIVTDLSELPFIEIRLVEQFTCVDNTAMIDIGSTEVGPDIHYEWNGPQFIGVSTPVIEPTQPGMYYLSVFNEITGCQSMDSIMLALPDPLVGVQANIVAPFCEGDFSGSFLITEVTGGTPAFTYSLGGLPLQSSPLFLNLMSGTYTLLVVDANGCSYQEDYIIPEGQSLSIDIGEDIELQFGDSIQLSATVSVPWSQIDSIVWSPDDHLSCTYCINPYLYGSTNATISATAYLGSCVDVDYLLLHVNLDVNIYIPNVFSPNGDDINDFFTIYGDDRVRRVVYLEIFDRWGNQVFVANDFLLNDPLLGWNGTFRGLPMNPAVFAYIATVELINGKVIPFKGDVTLLR